MPAARMAPLFTLTAALALCGSGPRQTCVVDGDTFWLNGEKIRIADINTPETDHAACPAERNRGEAAKRRLAELLGAGPFQLEVQGRTQDSYGRALRVVTRAGQSLGAQLVSEGFAEPWRGKRSHWCNGLAASLSGR